MSKGPRHLQNPASPAFPPESMREQPRPWPWTPDDTETLLVMLQFCANLLVQQSPKDDPYRYLTQLELLDDFRQRLPKVLAPKRAGFWASFWNVLRG